MSEVRDILRQGNPADVWGRCCGFIDLDIDGFMAIQRQLFAEQMEIISKCKLGEKLLKGYAPSSIEDFREKLPLTLYEDYEPYLSQKIETALPQKPVMWCRTSGRSNEYSNKWIPISPQFYQEIGYLFMAVLIFASSEERGKIAFTEGDKFLYALAPPPYVSGSLAHRMDSENILKFLPPLSDAEKMEFQDRTRQGFKMGLSEGIDMVAAIATILVAVGEQFGKLGGLRRLPQFFSQPRVLARLTGAMLKARLAGRPLMPKDIWKIKGLVSTGTDSYIFRDKIRNMWGRYPLDVYGAAESTILAMQTWDYTTMTFVPNLNLYEFIPEGEYETWVKNRCYRPKTCFYDEVVPGRRYVVVLTSFHGMPFLRYVMNDIVTVVSLHNEKTNVRLPQITFFGRADDLIDFEGFAHAFFTEKMLWEAIDRTGAAYVDWVARKEIMKGSPALHIYLEVKSGSNLAVKEVTDAIHKNLRAISPVWSDFEELFGYKPLTVTLLPSGAFANYIEARKASGADLAHIKPPHMNPNDAVIRMLVGGSVPNYDKQQTIPATARTS